MKMANFLMPKSTPASEVNEVAAVDPDITFERDVAVHRGPIGDIAAGARSVVVTNYGDDSVSLFNADTLEVEGVIAVEGEPFAAVVADDRAYVSTSSASFDAVSVIDTNTRTVIATYSLAFGVTALAISPDGKRIYAGRTGRDHVDVAVIDTTAERVGTIDIATGAGIGIDAVDVDPSGKRLYVATTDARGSQLVVVDTETARVERTVWVGSPIRDLAFADGTAYVLTSDRVRGGAVSVIDLSTNRITDTVDLGGAPTQMTLSADKARAYIVDYDQVVVLCTLSLEVVNSITIGARPSCVAVSPDGRLHVADYAGGVTVFAVVSTLPLLYSRFMATDPIAIPEIREMEPTWTSALV
jgi:YVTN family beta-propeller protein